MDRTDEACLVPKERVRDDANDVEKGCGSIVLVEGGQRKIHRGDT